MVTVLFICVQNAGRSQMAEAFFNHLSKGKHKGISAGSNPANIINPIVAEAMNEIGIKINDKQPKKLTKDMVLEADIAVTMGCEEDVCPVVPNELREWSVDDPKGKSFEEIRRIRDQVKKLVSALISEIDGTIA